MSCKPHAFAFLVPTLWVVSQEVESNDYWQAYGDPASGSFDLVFNVHNRGTNAYRLVR
jgi:hypothetical protein